MTAGDDQSAGRLHCGRRGGAVQTHTQGKQRKHSLDPFSLTHLLCAAANCNSESHSGVGSAERPVSRDLDGRSNGRERFVGEASGRLVTNSPHRLKLDAPFQFTDHNGDDETKKLASIVCTVAAGHGRARRAPGTDSKLFLSLLILRLHGLLEHLLQLLIDGGIIRLVVEPARDGQIAAAEEGLAGQERERKRERDKRGATAERRNITRGAD